MDVNNLNSFVSGITANLNGLLGELENTMKDATKNITPEQAVEMQKAWKDYKIDDKLQEIKRETIDLKDKFDI
jgi:hypothetical protein